MVWIELIMVISYNVLGIVKNKPNLWVFFTVREI